jgi:hypothetical protein
MAMMRRDDTAESEAAAIVLASALLGWLRVNEKR